MDITVLDKNDNAPEFIFNDDLNDILSSDQYLVSIQDNTPIGSNIIQIQVRKICKLYCNILLTKHVTQNINIMHNILKGLLLLMLIANMICGSKWFLLVVATTLRAIQLLFLHQHYSMSNRIQCCIFKLERYFLWGKKD